jgi:hypothetical protein
MRTLTWGPHFWFVLHSIAETYPLHPNAITKRKYYDTIQNFPLFLPDQKMGDRFAEMLLAYPVSPYLASRESFMRWVWFIHNKVNVHIGKPAISREEAYDANANMYRVHNPKIYAYHIGVPYAIAGAIIGATITTVILTR